MILLAWLALVAHAAPPSLESAAAAAQALRLPAAALAVADDPQALIDQLDDPDPNTRAAAARALKRFLFLNPAARAALVSVIERPREEPVVLVEALKSLSAAGLDLQVADALIDFAQDGNRPSDLRALAYRCLYARSEIPAVREALQDALGDTSVDEELREAAAWGLWQDGWRNEQTRRMLIGIGLESGQPEALRLEALKSLYSGMKWWDARDAMIGLATDGSAPENLRVTAVLLLHPIAADQAAAEALTAMEQSPSAALRAAARQASTPGMTEALTRYFHLDGAL